MSIRIIIGKNFGDEGKGLATDYFAAQAQAAGKTCLVIRHNGGGQAGHTVDFPDKRFVFHQLSSGSFRNADTYWSQTFLPDLYKLQEESDAFAALYGRSPRIWGHAMCRCVYIDDVLINMALETARGSNRHGSCGMGINEAVERSADSAYALYLGQICTMTGQQLYERLSTIRKEYTPRRLNQLGLQADSMGEYAALLSDENVLINAADQMHRAASLISVTDDTVVSGYDDILFEGAQGLLLDEDYLPFAPHLTSSKTGCRNPMAFLQRCLPHVSPEIVYVTRSYVTRHGAGPLPNEADWTSIPVNDPTNLPNDWQGALRFAPHGNRETFFAPALQELNALSAKHTVSYMVTHLNETGGKICSTLGNIPITQWFCGPSVPTISSIYLSNTPYAKDIRITDPLSKA